jgi:hypothetical protein
MEGFEVVNVILCVSQNMYTVKIKIALGVSNYQGIMSHLPFALLFLSYSFVHMQLCLF